METLQAARSGVVTDGAVAHAFDLALGDVLLRPVVQLRKLCKGVYVVELEVTHESVIVYLKPVRALNIHFLNKGRRYGLLREQRACTVDVHTALTGQHFAADWDAVALLPKLTPFSQKQNRVSLFVWV